MDDNFIAQAIEEVQERVGISHDEASDIISENIGIVCGLITLRQVIKNSGEYARTDSKGIKKLNELNERYPFDITRAMRNHDQLIDGALMIAKLSSASDHLFIVGRALTLFKRNLINTAGKFGYYEGFDTLVSNIREEDK